MIFYSSQIGENILTFPEGRGGITVGLSDYMRLSPNKFLNDILIDFWMKYIHTELIDEAQREKCHMFSQFFFTRLSTPMNGDIQAETAAQKHARVARWTKNVNLFEKDFIFVPINHNTHWFLSIICFPALIDTHQVNNQALKV